MGHVAPLKTRAVTKIGCADEAVSPSSATDAFYADVLRALLEAKLPFLVAGGYALNAYTGVKRPTKDLDIFTTAGEFPRILAGLKQRGFIVSIEDSRWIGKVHRGDDFVDVIFGSANGIVPVQEDWFSFAKEIEVLGFNVPALSPTELIWSKVFVQNRHRHDCADVVHVILRQHGAIDWRRLLRHMDAHWEVLLSHLLNFRFIFPSEQEKVPRWLIEELIDRLKQQLELPPPHARICRGRLFSHTDYQPAIDEWGFADAGSEGECVDG